jgi:hypothetical protein
MSSQETLANAQSLSYTPQPNAEKAWAEFELELSRALADLSEDEFLIIETKKDQYFVQFAGQGGFGMRMESVSNAYLDDGRRLSEEACANLQALGWNAPTNIPDHLDPEGHKPDGSPNYYLDIDIPVPYSSLATLAVKTLRGIFGAMHPGELQYRAFAEGGDGIRFPNLRIVRESSASVTTSSRR